MTKCPGPRLYRWLELDDSYVAYDFVEENDWGGGEDE
jgi:hypothetical protein